MAQSKNFSSLAPKCLSENLSVMQWCAELVAARILVYILSLHVVPKDQTTVQEPEPFQLAIRHTENQKDR